MKESRGIRRVNDVSIQENSSTHKSGLVVEPGNWEQSDPFLFMAEDYFQRGTFGMHPHRGIETVTYVIDGRLEHTDNKSEGGELYPGDVQWMTAGKGVIHAEEPARGDMVHSLQLWVNLPREHKMTEPRYQNLRKEDMPVRHEKGAEIRVFSGSSGTVKSDTKNYVPVTMLEINMDIGHTFYQDLPGHYNGFIYVLEGEGLFGKDQAPGKKGQVLWLEDGGEGESDMEIRALEKLRVLLYAGEPVRDPVVARGPFVMNSEEEIKQAYEDYRNGKFN